MLEDIYLNPIAVADGPFPCAACGKDTTLWHVGTRTPICGACAAFSQDRARQAIEDRQQKEKTP